MTNDQIRDLLKTLFAIVLAVTPLLAAFGPLSQYREVILLVESIIAALAGVFGFNLQSPKQQVRNIKTTRAQVASFKRMSGQS